MAIYIPGRQGNRIEHANFGNFDISSLSDQDLQSVLDYYKSATSRFGMGDPNRVGFDQKLAELQSEKDKRDLTNQQKEDMAYYENLYSGAPDNQQTFDLNAYLEDLTSGVGSQRQNIADLFKTQQEQGIRDIEAQYAPQRQQMIEEAAAVGGLQPNFIGGNLANADAARNRNVSDYIARISGARSGALADVENTLAQRQQAGKEFAANLAQGQNQFNRNLALSKAGALSGLRQGGRQFGQTFGLQRDIFNRGQAQQNLENLFNQRTLDQAERLGGQMAEARKPGTLDYLNTAFQGLGAGAKIAGLFRGGV